MPVPVSPARAELVATSHELALDDAIEEEDLDQEPYQASLERKVLIQPYDYAVRTLLEMVVDGDLKLDPSYQRNYRWLDEKASRFIESIALNIPVPVIYLAEEADGTLSVIDGQQRLTSLLRYLRPGDLAGVFPDGAVQPLELSGLKIRNDLNGKSFAGLERADKSLISKRPMRCIVVLNDSDETLKFEVFERLNTGSVQLTDQEVRNCLYRGAFNELLKDLAKSEQFRELISLPANLQHTMKDAELVLRFFAYRSIVDGSKYSENYKEFLNSFMDDQRGMSAIEAQELKDIFLKTVSAIYSALGPGKAFRKPRLAGDRNSPVSFSSKINGSIFESQMVAVSKIVQSGSSLLEDSEALCGRLLSAFSDPRYVNSVLQGGTAKKAKVLARVGILDSILQA